MLAGVLAALVACAYLTLILIGGSTRAAASPSVPSFLGQTTYEEFSGLFPDGIAVDQSSGEIYVTDYARVVKFSPYGAFILDFGKEVNRTALLKRREEEKNGEPVTVTPEEEDICTAASGDECNDQSGGSAGGTLSGASGVAVEQSTGDLYVVNRYNYRIEKYDASGHFLLTFGGRVNKAKTEAIKAKEAKAETPTATEIAEANICEAGEECQRGTQGKESGEFESFSGQQVIADGGPKELVYVGDEGRIQAFNSAGEFVQEISLSSLSATDKVHTLAVDSAGALFFTQQGIAGVHEVQSGGSLSSTVFDGASEGVEALAAGGSSILLVEDKSPSFHILQYEIGSPSATPSELGASEPGEVYRSPGLAVNEEAGAVDVATESVYSNGRHGNNGFSIFGSLSSLESHYGPPPSVAPTVGSLKVTAAPDEASAMLEGQVNPQFRNSTYQFEYGLAPCSSGGCTAVPLSPGSVGYTKTEHQAAAEATGLQLGRLYHYRLLATNSAGTTESAERMFTAGSTATAGPTGLPDGRVYEQVTPFAKNGNYFLYHEPFGLAAANGNSVAYTMTGAAGEAYEGLGGPYVSTRIPGAGWRTRSVTPAIVGLNKGLSASLTEEVLPSAEFTRFAFKSHDSFVQGVPYEGGLDLYLSENPAVEPAWLGLPEAGFEAVPANGHVGGYYELAGGDPSLSTVYFTYGGTLVSADASRVPNVLAHGSFIKRPAERDDTPWGFYEWSAGKLVSAGVLPSGSPSPFGAVPMGRAETSAYSSGKKMSEAFDNQVSSDGSRAFFVSPSPAASEVTNKSRCEREPPCTAEPPELYVRMPGPSGGKVSVLVSRSEMPGHEGQPAPDGIRVMPFTSSEDSGTGSGGYATPDGSQVFFASEDQLTPSAPANTEVKEYLYDVETGALTYLPGVYGAIAAVSANGSELLFVNDTVSPRLLQLWRAGSGGGTVSTIDEMPSDNNVNSAHISSDGSALVFGTKAELPGGFNNGGRYEEIYRYEVPSETLKCLSCPPPGQKPTGGATMGYNDGYTSQSPVETRAMTADGSRVFFDTPSALVPQDTNGTRDVYEWENGTVYLISSGTSINESLYLDSSESGNDVFFATSEALTPGEVTGTYNVFDARVPRPGDQPPAKPAVCEGSACQGPPSTPQLLGAPASQTFSGPNDETPPAAAKHKAKKHTRKTKRLTRKQKLKRALNACKKQKNKHKRARCERRARKRLGAKAARRLGKRSGARHGRAAKGNRHHNGRGK